MPGTGTQRAPLSNTMLWNQMVMDSLVASGTWGGLMRKAVGGSGMDAVTGKSYNDALINSLHAQASMYAESSKSLGDAAAMYKTAAGALADLGGIVERMGSLAAEYQSGAAPQEELGRMELEFQDLAGQAQAKVKNAAYKNITVLDGTERASEGLVSNQGLTVRAGASRLELRLNDFSQSLNFSGSNIASLKTLDKIREMVKAMEMFQASYLRQADTLDSGGAGFAEAADRVNAAAANRRGFWQDMSAENVMLSLLNRGTGGIASSTA